MKTAYLFLGLILLLSCNPGQPTSEITSEEDYNKYLKTAAPKTSSKYFELWDSKIKPDSLQLLSLGNVAVEYQRFFKETGDIQYLKKAENALQKAVTVAAVGKATYLRGLARNYISQHRFKEALVLAQDAEALGSGLKATQALLFDVHMELGNYKKAEHYLVQIKDMSGFEYLIRLSKWSDHKGDLDAAIRYMEKAVTKVEFSKNKGLMLWGYTNLADYYGHAGKLQKSYHYYLKALELDENNAYAKKGIAWIVFSHERNPKQALRILDAISKQQQTPDLFLLRAEIEDYLGNRKKKLQALSSYHNLVKQSFYGGMYNLQNAEFYLNETFRPKIALDLVSQEVANRATPETYGFLAYACFKSGDQDKALEIALKHVDGKTSEPRALLQLAEIYKAQGRESVVKKYKSELKSAIYELGPSAELKINNL